MNKQLRSKVFNKFFLSYLLMIFIFVGIFLVVSDQITFIQAKDYISHENQLSTNALKLKNYQMTTDDDYDWILPTTSSYLLYLNDDDYEEVNIPFTFQFYNQEFTTVYVSSNGWFSFENTEPYNYDNLQFPSSQPFYYFSGAIFMGDLYPNNNVFVHRTSNYLAIEYRDIDHYGGALAGSFQVVFYKNSIIKFQYDYISYLGPNPSVGLNFGYDTDYFNSYTELSSGADDLCLKFTYPGTNIGIYIGVGVTGGLVVIGGIIGTVFLVRNRRIRLGFKTVDGDIPLVYGDYITLEQESKRLLTPEEKSFQNLQDEIREIYNLYKSEDVILLDVLAEQFQVEDFLVEEAFNQLLAVEEIKGELNIMAKEFVVKK